MSELEALVLQLGDMVVKTRERCDVLESSFLSIQESNRQTFQAIQQDIDVKIKAMEESFAQVSKQLLATQEENAMLRKTIEEFQGKDSHFATSEDLDKKSGELQTELEEFKVNYLVFFPFFI